nr:hypothetical protein [Salmonella sp.]
MSLPFGHDERTIMTYLGFNEELNEEHGEAIWSDAESGVHRYITARGKDLSGRTVLPLHSLSNV